MRGAIRLTTALFPAMALVLVLSFSLSSRSVRAGGALEDRLFPAITRHHQPGAGAFLPGSFALSFFIPSFAAMVLLNLLFPARFGRLAGRGAKVFHYVAAVIIAICEVAADTLVPIL